MMGWFREWFRESKRASALKAYERRWRHVGFTTYDTVRAFEGFRNAQQICDELFCALLRPGVYAWKSGRPGWEFELDALEDGTMRVRAFDANNAVVGEHLVPLSVLIDRNNGYDGGSWTALMNECRTRVGA